MADNQNTNQIQNETQNLNNNNDGHIYFKHDEYHESIVYPKIQGKLKYIFGLSPKIINLLHKELYNLYSNSSAKKPVLSQHFHKIFRELFINEYYPVVSRNIKHDEQTTAIIMGTVAYNMNVPKNLKYLQIDTDDIDVKIYTTAINYIEKKHNKVASVLSVFKYVVVILCMFMKQVITEVIEFGKHNFESPKSNKNKNKHKHTKKQQNISKHNNTTTHTKKQLQKGGNIKPHNIKLYQKGFGFLNSAKITLILKQNKLIEYNEYFDVTQLSYVDTFDLIMKNINNPELLITTKIKYNMTYNKEYKIKYNKIPLTFSDTQINYANLEHTSFFANYFMNNKKKIHKPLELLIKEHIKISDIINIKSCMNNCNYTAIPSLQIDLVVMLQYAELLKDEDIDSGKIIVPIGFIFKYHKYIIKFIRLNIIKKYKNGTLNKSCTDISTKLLRYIVTNIKNQTINAPENSPINILFKSILNKFHQAFFMEKTMFPEYEELHDLVNEYHNIVYYINCSRALFKNLDDKSMKNGDEYVNPLNSFVIQKADKDIKSHKSVGGGIDGGIDGGGKQYSKKDESILLFNNDLDDDNNDVDVEIDEIEKSLKSSSKSFKSLKSDKHLIHTTNKEKLFIMNKLSEIVNKEIKYINKFSQSL